MIKESFRFQRIMHFHPAVRSWFAKTLGVPTPIQRAAWPLIRQGHPILLSSPTGSGKTLAAFLGAIDKLVRRGQSGRLTDEISVLYVSPLRALSYDVHKNLLEPLVGINRELATRSLPTPEVRVAVRTGDTPSSERARMLRHPPHLLVTTPESLYLLLGSAGGRGLLSTVEVVILDEIHAVASGKRGAHLSLSLERLSSLTRSPFQRIGLSATQRPIRELARFLTGASTDRLSPCAIVDLGSRRKMELTLELPSSPLEPVLSTEVWEEIYDRLADLARSRRTTLVFVNSRRLAERVAHHLTGRLGEERVAAHHGSLSRERRLEAEKRLKTGSLSLLVATSSLELGIDVGEIDLVCQLGSPRSISSLLQRVGRSGHRLGKSIPEGRLFPLSQEELVECAGLLLAVGRGILDRLSIPDAPLDVLAQQIVAEIATGPKDEETLFAMIRRAYPYRRLSREEFLRLVQMLADGYSPRRERSNAFLFRDLAQKRILPRKGARLAALLNGGAIPDTGDYPVIADPEGITLGTVNEDFALESLPGDVFALGNSSWRLRKIERGAVRVEDAQGEAPTIPFWLGELPGRSQELSACAGVVRRRVHRWLAEAERRGIEHSEVFAAKKIERWLALSERASLELCSYLAATRAALGFVPHPRRIGIERFFDPSGATQLVIHSPFGSRVNRAWGLALRKRFCRKFNFELQAAATEDAILLSLTHAHSFPLEEILSFLRPETVRAVLIQALLASPMFAVRWRWNASISLAIPRRRGGRKIPPLLQRMEAEELLGAIFPDAVACLENISGDRECPDHPLVEQTLRDCLSEVMDLAGLEKILRKVQEGKILATARDLREPSPAARSILAAHPYSFLDPAPLEERRARAVAYTGRLPSAELGQLSFADPEAVRRVREEAWPDPEDPDQMEDALLLLGFVTLREAREGRPDGLGGSLRRPARSWEGLLGKLAQSGRALTFRCRPNEGDLLWTSPAWLAHWKALFPQGEIACGEKIPIPNADSLEADFALREILRGRLQGLGPVSSASLGRPLELPAERLLPSLSALEAEGFLFRGRWLAGDDEEQWCARGLIARIHRYGQERARRSIRPVSGSAFLRFLLAWQRLTPDERTAGPESVLAVLPLLEGICAPPETWEQEILPARIDGYDPAWLERLCLDGRFFWIRLRGPREEWRAARLSASSPIAILPRGSLPVWLPADPSLPGELSHRAEAIVSYLRSHGPSFLTDLQEGCHLLRTETAEALAELAGSGLVHSDGFSGLRLFLSERGRRRNREVAAGRWSLVSSHAPLGEEARAEAIARVLLRRYGVVFRKLLSREEALPPWWRLLDVYRRLEARGEIRSGRFVAGFSGEQFALPEAAAALWEIRERPATGDWISVCGADPANLVGIVTPGERIAALGGNRLLYRDGEPMAALLSGKIRFFRPLEPREEWEATKRLLRRAAAYS
ncbi:DEAD-box ATP-dependent RNA helicase CshA [Methylacidimicrobium cyclopophantes]|uniref:DEAD-box ATP-dependent RNA helicase CshA n=1 Tax=Methylacidimicrobium cyclopophantes TaxID=1041766 RepID=A0A5E6MGU3_9BACT|nr:DEAD/DEAH box helicase [Methylacidimicrobium cyclopophantes]VVM07095.1 DEAD-box ATP-dependent RNA helicase CshA [Methylacidimicrobium cyclopophantes]